MSGMMPDCPERPRPDMPCLPRVAHASALVFLVTVSLAGVAVAADTAPKASADKAAPGRVLTPAQLRDCVAQKERLHKLSDTALKDKADIAADKAEIDRGGVGLKEQAAVLDRTSAEAIEAYNAKVDARDKLIDSYQDKVTAYNKEAEDVRATKDAYEKSCENRLYDERDLKDIQRKK